MHKKGHQNGGLFYWLFSWLGRTFYLIKNTTAHLIEVLGKNVFLPEITAIIPCLFTQLEIR